MQYVSLFYLIIKFNATIMYMSKEIYQTENFIVETLQRPHISRTDGGHIFISPKVRILDRTLLSPKYAIEMMRLTMIAGEAMTTALNKNGINIERINYQDNGNWGVFKPEGTSLHIHLYGRSKSAVTQKYGEALNFPLPDTGFYDSFEPLNDEDIDEIKKEIENIFNEEKYQDLNWCL
jgi:diadenosine tetraphosphate (Ap4A) HIT family hydrolase